MNDRKCRLFLVAPPDRDVDTFAASFDQAARAGDVACLLVRQMNDPDETAELISAVLTTGYERDVAILVEGDVDMAARTGADGVLVEGGLEAYNAARSALGSDRIVGVLANGSRHTAMEVGEAGADFLAFDQSQPHEVGSGDDREELDPIAWWAELFEVPAVAFSPAGIAEVERLVKTGSNFIRPEDVMWSSPDRAVDTVKRYNTRIEEFE